MAAIVRGEASESDDEITGRQKIFAAEVSGEATESDEDVYEKSCSVNSTYATHPESVYRNNLLQRKLIENNINIWKALNNVVKNYIQCASKQIINTDQLLIKCQVSMQSVLSSLKLAQINAEQLQRKTETIVTAKFIPNINIQKKS